MGRPLMTDEERNMSLLQRFCDKYTVGSPNECWLWLGATSGSGDKYGMIFVRRNPETRIYAHILAWLIANDFEEIPKGMQICHKCDQPLCVNPNHLFLGTPSDNVQDMLSKGRHNNQQKTHCPKGHEYTEENTRRLKRGGRQCLTCYRDMDRERSRLRRAR